jgi:hypothetical protein
VATKLARLQNPKTFWAVSRIPPNSKHIPRQRVPTLSGRTGGNVPQLEAGSVFFFDFAPRHLDASFSSMGKSKGFSIMRSVTVTQVRSDHI